MSRRGLVSLTARREVRRQAGALGTAATARIEEQHDWYQGLSAKERSWVGLVAQAGITSFVEWLDGLGPADTVSAFGAAPRELTRSISLAQTLDLVRSVVDVVEEHVEQLARPQDVTALREAVLRYSREVAFGAAQVYAEAAEQRGAWDARLESLVIDAVLRGEMDDSMRSRAAALGWGSTTEVAVVVGDSPTTSDDEATDELDRLHRAAVRSGLSVIAGVQGHRLVAVLGGVTDPLRQVTALADCFGPGPLVVGPTVPDLGAGDQSAAAALAGHDSAPGWPARPHPCLADDLLAERALDGDPGARQRLVADITGTLTRHPALLETARAHLDSRGGLEGTARQLIVHVNTVRYRLGRIADLTGYDLADPHDAFTVRVALTLGALLEETSKPER